MRNLVGALGVAIAATACGGGMPPNTTPSYTPSAPGANGMPTRWDGFTLGDRYASVVMKNAPYATPCDDDPIEKRGARAMVYGGRPCRNLTFPNDTSVVFILEYRPREDYDAPIRAFGWLGPYYDDKVVMPIKRGEPPARAHEVLGPPLASFDLKVLHADVWKDTAVFSDRGQIVGFAFGELPPDPNLERWRVFDQMYRRYTPRPRTGTVDEADCLSVLRHAATLAGEDPDAMVQRLRAEDLLDREVAECRDAATPDGIACALAATTGDELAACERK
ncbi:MAG: hypothetical protein KF773_18085 [Deltaproteobacteria bacterium]|nr:hypothetical protein [Deltaproteobacteria bacterium]